MSEINYIHTEDIHNTKSAEEILPYIFDLFKPHTLVSVIDVGCGTGSWLKASKKLGAIIVQGVDGIYPSAKMICIGKDEFKIHDLTLPLQLNTKYNLAICLEVAEHLPETAADNLIEILTQHSDIVLFSAAIPEQGGQFHTNEQWPEYWRRKFANNGYLAFDIIRDKFWENEKVEWWYKQNMFIYSRENILGLKPDRPLISRIHPDLFKLKVNSDTSNKRIIEDKIWNPKFFPTFKLLIKSILKINISSIGL